MTQHEPWDQTVAASYDANDADMFSPEVLGPTVTFLAGLAAGRPVLEFAAGTGGVTLPLAATGLEVSAIEMSEPMAARLRAKPGAERIELTMGDMAVTRAPGEFGLVYLVYDTISNLLTQHEQVACFANAAAHLAPGGHFVVEVCSCRSCAAGRLVSGSCRSTSVSGTWVSTSTTWSSSDSSPITRPRAVPSPPQSTVTPGQPSTT